MYRKLDDFLNTYPHLVKSTLAVFNAMDDDALNRKVADDHRTLGHIAWHIVTSIPEMMNKTGLAVSSVAEDAPPPASADTIREGYRAVTDELMLALKSNWTDETLEVVDNMYGMEWSRGTTLGILCNHEFHHRGQMTILLRQAGKTVPGTMGPAKEEWAKYGMPDPAY